MLIYAYGAIIIALLLAGCAMETPQAHDERICRQQGHAPGSEAFRNCMAQQDEARARNQVKTLERDLNDYERFKQDRIHQQGRPF